jgi:hypothetical protein
MPASPIEQFDHNIGYTKDLLALGRAVDAATTGALDIGDLQRAAIVMAVSALDHYVHEKARNGMQQILSGQRVTTDAFERFPLTMKLALEGGPNPGESWLDEAIQAQHGHRPFLKTDDIAEAMRLISSAQLWNEVGVQLNREPSAVKAELKTVIDRRNKIAHEADLDPTQPGRRWPMSDALAKDAVDYVEQVVQAIDTCV